MNTFNKLFIPATLSLLTGCSPNKIHYKSIFYATTECVLTDDRDFSLELSIYEIDNSRSASLEVVFYGEGDDFEWSAPDAIVRDQYVSFTDKGGGGYILLRTASGENHRRSDGFVVHLVEGIDDIIYGTNGLCDEWLFEHEGRY